jgi:hypothetical protein
MSRLRRPSPALVVASLALAVALSGTGYAAMNLPSNSVGTKQLKNNAVVASKVKAHTLLMSHFKAGQMPRGPAGPQGLPGAAGQNGDKGDKGDSATKLFTAVKQKADGTAELGPHSGFELANHPKGSNLYVLTTPAQSLGNCVVLAAPNKDASGNTGVANAAATGDKTVTVETFSTSGDPTGLSFTVAAFC